MRKFSTSDGQEWSIDLPVGAIGRVKSESNGRFNLWHPFDGDPVTLNDLLMEDFEAFFELLVLLLDAQMKERGITADKLGMVLEPQCIVDAQFAFYEEWRDFFHKLQRPKMATALEKQIAYRRKMVEIVAAKLTDPRMKALDEKMGEKMESILNQSFGSLLDSLESTLAVSPGDN